MLNHEPLITVYITNFNYGKYISQAVDSVLNQTIDDYEIIIIDDGSTDNSEDIIRRYERDPKISVVYQKNKGLTVSNNIALNLARGKFIVRLDADDFFEVDALEKLSTVLLEKSSVGMVFGDWNIVNENSSVVSRHKRFDFSKEVTLYDQPAHGACTMFRTSCLKRLNGYDESLSCQDGYELWLRFIDHYDVQNINDVIFYYRMHGANLTGKEERILSTRAEILRKHAHRKRKKSENIVAIIPIRGANLDKRSLPFSKLGDKFLFQWTLDAALANVRINTVVITTPDRELIEFVEKEYSQSKLIALHRPDNIAYINKELKETILHTFESIETIRDYDYMFLFSIETPFKPSYLIDSAIDMAVVFGVEHVVGVRQDNNVYYKHGGNGLYPINQNDSHVRLERDELYRSVTGFHLSSVKYFMENNCLSDTNLGHIIFEQKSAMEITSELDLRIANMLVENGDV